VTTLHERLAAELARRTAVANAVRFERTEPHDVGDWQDIFHVTVHGYLHLPPGIKMMVQSAEAADALESLLADALRRYAGELDLLQRYDELSAQCESRLDAHPEPGGEVVNQFAKQCQLGPALEDLVVGQRPPSSPPSPTRGCCWRPEVRRGRRLGT
jgi:hypothetical protein